MSSTDNSCQTSGQTRSRAACGPVESLVRRLASQRITVALLILSMILVFAGTLAQTDQGIWEVAHEYFRTFFARVELKNLIPPFCLPPDMKIKGAIFLPGGFLIGGVFLINLGCAYMVHFKVVARGLRLVAGCVLLILSLIATWAICNGFFQEAVASTMGSSYMRVVWRLAQGLIPGLLLLGSGLLLYHPRKAGVHLIHFSVLLLLVAELTTSIGAVESRMVIREGESTSFIDNSQDFELAFIQDRPGQDSLVACVPWAMLQPGKTIQLDAFKMNVQVEEVWKNATATVGKTPGVTAGLGLDYLMAPVQVNSGVSMGGTDAPGLVVTLRSLSGEELGCWGFSTLFYANFLNRAYADLYQEMESPAGRVRMMLRNKREYLHSVPGDSSSELVVFTLKDFRFDRYMGTNTPKNYSSLIHLHDGAKGIDRDVNIWMNNPLRYLDRTFYQQNFSPDERGTVLQVVANSGWMLPYIATMIAALGMLFHFGQLLLGFLRKAFNNETQA